MLLTTLISSMNALKQSNLNSNSKISNPGNLPAKIRSNIKGTWSYDTMSRRIVENILPRIIEDNSAELSQPTASERAEAFMLLNDLKSSLKCGHEGYLQEIYDKGDDIKVWNEEILGKLEFNEKNWLDSPWLISEYYFYRRIASIFGYFETRYDPFVQDKFRGLVSSLDFIEGLSYGYFQNFEEKNIINEEKSNKLNKLAVKNAILTSLWGNKLDLSLWPATDSERKARGEIMDNFTDQSKEESKNTDSGTITFGDALEKLDDFILDNQLHITLDKLSECNSDHKVIGIVVDNAGYELVTDLYLGHCLLAHSDVDEVIYMTKGHPTFVSDATSEDSIETIKYLNSLDIEKYPYIVKWAKHLESHIESQKFKFIDDCYWCQPFEYWNMPEHIVELVKSCHVTFVKGDANYRRLLGDREWPLDTPSKDILDYWPGNVCALRTFKAELGCGITPEKQKYAQEEDNCWLTSGRFGVIQNN